MAPGDTPPRPSREVARLEPEDRALRGGPRGPLHRRTFLGSTLLRGLLLKGALLQGASLGALAAACRVRRFPEAEEIPGEGQNPAAPRPQGSATPLAPSVPVGTLTPTGTVAVDTGPEPRIEERSRPSPNKSARVAAITRIVLHNTEASLESTLATLTNPKRQASAHLVVGRGAEVYRLVADSQRAWHATVANDGSLGLEIVAGPTMRGMTETQERMVIACVKRWMRLHGVPATGITVHRIAAPKTTDCPTYIWPEGREELFYQWRKKHFGA